jgi:hypothetical protein
MAGINYAYVFQTAADESIVPELTSRAFEANANQVRYNGGNTLKIAKVTTGGLGTYNRSTGFPSGTVDLDWETFTFSMDRGIELNLDAQDVDEANFIPTASMVLGTLQKDKIAPEVDAYRYSSIFARANQALRSRGYTVAAASVFTQIKTDIKTIQSVIGENEQLDCYISYDAADALDKSTEIDRSLPLVGFTAGGITTEVKSIDGIPLIRVPTSRFKSAFTFSATDGYSDATGAMELNWVIVARRAVIAVVKTDKVRVFTPDQNQAADAWKIQTRKYHGCWITDNKLTAIYVNYKLTTPVALTGTFAAGSATNTTKCTVTGVTTGNSLYYSITDAQLTDVYQNDVVDPDDLTAYVSAANTAATTATKFFNIYELDATNHVVRFVSHDIASNELGA